MQSMKGVSGHPEILENKYWSERMKRILNEIQNTREFTQREDYLKKYKIIRKGI